MKNNLTGEKISLARVAFNKSVLQAIEKIKGDPKVEGWKRTFIQFKSRSEKKKSWKEKMKQLKDIDSRMNIDQQDPKSETEEEEDEDEEKEKKVANGNGKEKKILPTKENKILQKDKAQKERPKMRQVKFSDDESSQEDEESVVEDELSDEESVGVSNSEMSESEEQSDLEEEEEEEDSVLNDLKPLVFENKPSRMVIKQLNLDEIKELSEIPIEARRHSEHEDSEDENEEKTTPVNTETIKIGADPFFLDQNGNEIEGDAPLGVQRYQDYGYQDRDYQSRDYQNRDRFRSSFKSSLNRDHRAEPSYNSRSYSRNESSQRPFHDQNKQRAWPKRSETREGASQFSNRSKGFLLFLKLILKKS